MKNNESVISETEGVYTTSITVTELRDKILLRIVLLILLWPVTIITAVVFVVTMPEEYHGITIPALFLTFLFIIPIALVVRNMAKKFHKDIVYVNKSVVFKIKQETAYMDEVKVKIVIDYLEDCFKIYTSRFEGYIVDGRETEEFRIFLEDNRIPYV